MTKLAMQDQKGKKFSERLKIALEEAGVRGAEVARCIGVSPTAVSRWLQGKREIKLELLEKLHQKYGVNPYYILTGEGPPLLPREDKDVLAYTGKKNFLGRMKKSSWSDITVL